MYAKSRLKYFLGYLQIEVEGYYIEKFLNLCTYNKIDIWGIKKQKNTKIYLNISIDDFKKLPKICKKTKVRIKIQKKIGIPFIFNRYKKRKFFLFFIALILILIYISSCYIWNIEICVEDNLEVIDIEKDLNSLGVKKGALKKSIDTDEVVNEIRLVRDDISWIGIDIKGTNLIVNIVKADNMPEIIDNNDYCNIVSTKSGIIDKVVAQNGTPMVKVGDSVEKGDVLIAGYIDGKYTNRRFVHSLGEVEARIFYTKSKKIPLNFEVYEKSGQFENKFQIKFNNFQINFYKTLSNFEIYDTIYTEQNLKIFSNFYLPISIVKITNNELVKNKKNFTTEEAKDLGVQQLGALIENEIENTENIQNINVDLKQFETYIEIYVTYEVLENIGTYEKIEY